MNKKFHLLKLVACIMSSVCIMQGSTLWSMEIIQEEQENNFEHNNYCKQIFTNKNDLILYKDEKYKAPYAEDQKKAFDNYNKEIQQCKKVVQTKLPVVKTVNFKETDNKDTNKKNLLFMQQQNELQQMNKNINRFLDELNALFNVLYNNADNIDKNKTLHYWKLNSYVGINTLQKYKALLDKCLHYDITTILSDQRVELIDNYLSQNNIDENLMVSVDNLQYYIMHKILCAGIDTFKSISNTNIGDTSNMVHNIKNNPKILNTLKVLQDVLWNLTHNIYGKEGIKNIVYQKSPALVNKNYWPNNQEPTPEKNIPYIVANNYDAYNYYAYSNENYINEIKKLVNNWYNSQCDPFCTQNCDVIYQLKLKDEIESMKQSYRDAMKQAKLNEDVPFYNLLLHSDNTNHSIIKQYYNANEMKDFVMMQKAIYKEVIDFRDNRNKIKQSSKESKYITTHEQLQKKFKMFGEALKDLYGKAGENEAVLKRLSMVFKQLSLRLNNKASNIEELYKNVKDNYEMYYLLKSLATNTTTEVSEDVSTNLLLSIIWGHYGSEPSITNYLQSLNTDTVIKIYNNYLNMLKKHIDENNNTNQQQLEQKIDNLLNTIPVNNTIERIIKEIKDEHLLETFDLFMSLIIKLSKE